MKDSLPPHQFVQSLHWLVLCMHNTMHTSQPIQAISPVFCGTTTLLKITISPPPYLTLYRVAPPQEPATAKHASPNRNITLPTTCTKLLFLLYKANPLKQFGSRCICCGRSVSRLVPNQMRHFYLSSQSVSPMADSMNTSA